MLIAQGDFLKRSSYSAESRWLNNISSTAWNDFESLGADTLDTSGRASKGPNTLTTLTAEIRHKEELRLGVNRTMISTYCQK